MAASSKRALARKITRKQARSYDRMTPNRRGVTALSEVNGRGSYAKRYAATRALLKNKKARATAKRKRHAGGTSAAAALYRAQLKKGRSAAQARATVAMLHGRSAASAASHKKSKRSSAAPKKRSTAKKKSVRRALPGKSKSAFIAGQKRKGRSAAQAEASWRLLCQHVPKVTRSCVAGKARPNRARKSARKNAGYRLRSSRLRPITGHSYLRAKPNARAAAQALSSHRRELRALRDRRTARSAASPNPGRRSAVLSFEEWKSMKKNKRRSAKRGKKTTKRKSRKGFAAMSKSARCAAARKGGRKTAARRRKARPCDTTGRKTKRRASARKSTGRKRKTTKKRKSTKKRSRRRHPTKVAAKRATKRRKSARKPTTRKRRKSTKKRQSAYARGWERTFGKKKMTANRRRRRRARRNNGTTALSVRRRRPYTIKAKSFMANRRRHRRRHLRRNVPGAQFKAELMTAFKYGGIVTAGFVGHRVLTNLLDKYALSKFDALNTGSVAPWRKVIAAGIVAAVGIPVTVRALPKHAGVAAAGMAASFIYGLVMVALQKLEQPEMLEAVSAYPDAPGYAQYSGYGSYYEYQPRQVYGGASGFGEYYEYGDPHVEQAAAGFGGGLQQMYANPVGEYYAYGAEAIGEYEAAAGYGGGAEMTHEGIYPNLHSAEQALNVSEAAAGIGFGAEGPLLTQAAAGYGYGDLPLENTVDPLIRAMDIPDEPGGSRAGILAGGDGIFG